MSILKALGVRSVVLSFVEVVLFFAILTPLYFSLVATAYALVAWVWGVLESSLDWTMVLFPFAPSSLARWAAVLPVWMWAIEILGYLLLVTIYWAPGEETQNHKELGGLVLFAALSVLGSLAWLEGSHQAVSGVAKTFWDIVTGQPPVPR